MILFAVFLTIIILLPDLYIYFSFVKGCALFWNLLFWLPSTLSIGLLVMMGFGYIPHWTLNWLSTIIICLALPKLLFSLISILGRGLGLMLPDIFVVTNYLALAILIIAVLSTTYGFVFGWKRLQVIERPLNFVNLPKSFDGYKIVQISDLHVGAYGNNTKFIKKIVNAVNEQHPDLIVFTGDLVDMSADELLPFVSELSQLNATDGVISILGNHDYSIYGNISKEEQIKNIEKLKQYEKSFGWNLLLNENQIIRRGNDSIAVIGVENSGKGNFPKLADLPKAMKGIDNKVFTILLSHDPSHWRMEVLPTTEIPLTLSGHTHAMQLKIGKFSPSSWIYPEWRGLYSIENQQLYVSSGVGATLRFRLGVNPQIDVLTLN